MSTSPKETLCRPGSSRERFATSRIPTPLRDSKEFPPTSHTLVSPSIILFNFSAIYSLVFTCPSQLSALKNIDELPEIETKLIRGFLCGSVHPSAQMVTPLSCHVLFVLLNNLSM
jgi:hypothetical protein